MAVLQRPTPGKVPESTQPEPEVAAFTAFIKQLFDALGTSLTRYAARVNRDKGSVSRYFNGLRIAPKDFVDELIRQVADLTGNPVTDEVRAQAHQLRLEALRVRNASQHELEQLRESLGAAERELHLASVRERALLRALEAAEDHTHQAEQRYRQLESDWAIARYASGSTTLDIYARPDGADELRDEILSLKAEVEALRIELSRAQALKHATEEQCVRLEARLLAAEAALQSERARSRSQAIAELSTAGPEVRPDLQIVHRCISDMNGARSLAGTLQAAVEGMVHGLGFKAAAVSLARPDGDLTVAAVWEVEENAESGLAVLLGQVGSRESWEQALSLGDEWGTLRFVPYDRYRPDDVVLSSWTGDGPLPVHADDWHPHDLLFAPMYSTGGDLLGVLQMDQPRSGKRPGVSARATLEMFSLQASIAIGNAQLRAEMQRALARLEKEQQALRASEDNFRQAFEYSPSGMAITELQGTRRGQLTQVNDALCRLLGRPRAVLRLKSFADLVHPEDRALLEHVSAEAMRAEVRLSHHDGGYLWVRIRNSIVADAATGPAYVLSTVDYIGDLKGEALEGPSEPRTPSLDTLAMEPPPSNGN